MKRLTTVTILSAFAALALGCKGDASPAKKPAADERSANAGPLLPPGHGGFGGAGGGAPAAGSGAAGGMRQRVDGAPGPLAGARRWGEAMTPEQREARREEMRARRAEERQMMIDTFDADHDGQLSPEERTAMHEARMADMIGRLDTDKDGKLNQAELEAIAGRRRAAPDFAAIDLDKDGFVTVEEMAKSRPPGGPGRGPGGRGGWGGGPDDGAGDGASPPTTRTVPATPPATTN